MPPPLEQQQNPVKERQPFRSLALQDLSTIIEYQTKLREQIGGNNVFEAKSTYAIMKQQFPADAVTENLMLLGYARSGSYEEALQLLEAMQKQNFKIENNVFPLLINLLGKNDQKKALSLFQSYLKQGGPKSSVDYANLLEFFGTLKNQEVMEGLINTLLKDKVTMDVTLLEGIITAYSKLGSDTAVHLFWEMAKRKLPGFNMPLYTCMLAHYNRFDHLRSKTDQLWKEIENSGLPIPTVAYHTMLLSTGKRKQFEEMRRIVGKMVAENKPIGPIQVLDLITLLETASNPEIDSKFHDSLIPDLH